MGARILLVDDEPDLIDLLAYNLRQAGFEILTAFNGAAGLSAARAERPDLVILDVMMPQMSGYEVCTAMRADPALQDVLILMLTARNEEIDEVRGLEVGADDYVPKPVSPKLLVSRVRALLRRSDASGQEGGVLQVRDLEIDRDRFVVLRRAAGTEERMHFPRKEFELLYLLASEPGRVHGREELLDRVWGTDVFVTNRTVDVHVRKIRQKLGPGYVETVKGVGYRMAEHD